MKMQKDATRAVLLALGLLVALVPRPGSAQERPLGEEVEQRERAESRARTRVYRDSTTGFHVQWNDGNDEESRPRFLYRASMRTSCARMGISFMGDDTIRVHEVLPGSGAEEAGIRAGDVIVSVQGERANQRTMEELAASLEPGDRVRLSVRRDGRVRDIDVTAREDVCPYRTMLSGEPLHMLCEKTDSADGATEQECEGIFTYRLRDRLESLHREIPWSVHTEMFPDSGVWVRFRGHDGPGDSIFIDLDSVRIMSEAVSMQLDSLGAMMPFVFGMTDSIRQLMPRIHMDLRQLEEEAHASGLMLRSLELGARALAGAQLADLNADLAEYFDAERGVLVTSVETGTPAARAGLQGGDVILAVNGNEVDDVGDVRRHTAQAEGTIELTIQRRGERRTVTLAR